MEEDSEKVGQKLAPFNPANDAVVETALRLLQLRPKDTFFDLGCGDGRLLIAAAERCGARAVGFEYDRRWVDAARKAAAARGLLMSSDSDDAPAVASSSPSPLHRHFPAMVTKPVEPPARGSVRVDHANVLDVSFDDATAIYAYLVPEGMRALQERLLVAIRERGVRVVTYVFSLPGVTPAAVENFKGTKIYLYLPEGVASPDP